MADTVQDVFFPFSGPDIPPSRRASRIPPDQWTQNQETIKVLYIDRKKTLEEVAEIMKREHNFHATPRQYTEKFRSWHLEKNARQHKKRKPRCTASVYRDGSEAGGRQQRLEAKESILTNELYTTLDNQNRNDRDVDSAASLEPILEDSFDSTLAASVNRSEKNYSTLNGPVEAMQATGPTVSSRFGVEDDHETLEDMTPWRVSSTGSSGATGINSTLRTRANLHSVMPGAVQGCRIKLLERAKHDSLKTLQSFVLAVWGAWYSGKSSQFASVSNVVGYFLRLGQDAADIYSIAVSLDRWTSLYPRSGNQIPFPHCVPSPANYNEGFSLWKMYSDEGCIIASAKQKMSPTQREAYVSQATGKLVTAILLAADGSTRLRLLFSMMLTQLEPILEEQVKVVEIPCQRIFKLFPLHLPGLEDREVAMRSQQKNEAAILAMVCAREFRAQGIFENPAFREMLGMIGMGRLLLWTARLMLYYASPTLAISPLPSDLCLRALDGCRQILNSIHCHPHQSQAEWKTQDAESPVSDKWQDARFASVLAEWICCDSEFFLYHQTDSEGETDVPIDLSDNM